MASSGKGPKLDGVRVEVWKGGKRVVTQDGAVTLTGKDVRCGTHAIKVRVEWDGRPR